MHDKIGPLDNLEGVAFTDDWALQISNFSEASLHPTSDWLTKLKTYRADDKPFAAFIHLLDKEYLTCTHATLSDARKELEITAKFVPTKQLLSKFFTTYDKLIKNFEHQKRRIPGGDDKYRYPWHAYYSVLLQAIQRGSHAYNSKIELQAMELRLHHNNIFPDDTAGENPVAEFKSQNCKPLTKPIVRTRSYGLQKQSCTQTTSLQVSRFRPKRRLPSTMTNVNVPRCSLNRPPSSTTIVVGGTVTLHPNRKPGNATRAAHVAPDARLLILRLPPTVQLCPDRDASQTDESTC
jgi:hypothetical protein